MGRVLSPYEIAWRKSAGHSVDDDELERLTAPDAPVVAAEPVAVEQPAIAASTPVTSPVAPATAPVAAPPAAPSAKPTGKK